MTIEAVKVFFVFIFGNFFGISDDPCFPPIAEYYSDWTGEQLFEHELEQSNWIISEIEMVVNLWHPEELPTYKVYITSLGTAVGEPQFETEGGFRLVRVELEAGLDAGHFD